MKRISPLVKITLTNNAIDRYFELLKESKIRGYLFQQQNHLPESK